MENTMPSPESIINSIAQLDEVKEQLKQLLSQIKPDPEAVFTNLHSNGTHYPTLDQDFSHDDNRSSTVASDDQSTSSHSSPVSFHPETPEHRGEQVEVEEMISPNCLQGDIIPDQNTINYNSTTALEDPSLAALASLFTLPEYTSDPYPQSSVFTNLHFNGVHCPTLDQDFSYDNNPSSTAASDDQSTSSNSSPVASRPKTPEHCSEQVDEEMISPNCLQGDIIPDQNAINISYYSITPLEDPSLASLAALFTLPEYTFGAYPQPSFAPQYPQNVYSGYNGTTDELGDGMDYNQLLAEMENYTPAYTNDQNILQDYEIKRTPTLSASEMPFPSFTTVKETPNFALGSEGGQGYHTTPGTPTADITQNMFSYPSSSAYPLEGQQFELPQSYSNYSSLNAALGSITADEFAQQTWSQ